MDGLLVIDKPVGPTSHDVVARVRRILGERRVGHTGTLDPIATGVLPLVVGRATRLARFLSGSDKIYEARIGLGVATDTYDAQGVESGTRYEGPWPSTLDLTRALEGFRGQFLQRPPAYSAKRVGGRRSYDLARGHARQVIRSGDAGGDAPARPAPASVTVHRLEVLAHEGNTLTIVIECSAGFYVRTLAHDLGQTLGIGAHLVALRRRRAGDSTLADALALEAAERDPDAARRAVVPLDQMLPGLPSLVLSDAAERRARQGQDLEGSAAASPYVRLVDGRGRLLAIAEPTRRPGILHPSVVLG